ncbi:DnaJ domain-containing protein [Protomyces lactucae-debilis]|uniref:DnaJ domain-containing protein n=1 Tax=Protomyces lactucae-debilis TaxID=2754530 RepID=A0A1Y2FGH7_PROLT|nr:DnaJ domain-containing protein [Protomyces lactucae-debilis]ORY83048.1 DnaJ domain-containing protein [Protomyces lactucae-debilis]
MNADEAQKCIEIATRKLQAGDKAGAHKFALKAAALHDSPQVQQLLQKIVKAPATTPSADGAAGSSRSEGGATQRTKAAASKPEEPAAREYTPDQAKVVKRIRKCQATAFYEILDIKREATEAEVKKAYRKLALQLHPDKNGAPGADEAFKMVSRAFQILSDASKRSQFDRYGADPDQRGGGAPAANSFQRANGGGGMQGGMFGEEMNADDLFNMFFGGGGGMGGGFGGSPFVSFGGPGVRVHHFGGGQARQHRGQQGEERASLAQLLPLIILFGFSLLSSLFSGGSWFGSGSTTPSYAFNNHPPYTQERLTPVHKIQFFVNPEQIASIGDPALKQFDKKVEVDYIRNLRDTCEWEYQQREQEMNNAYGFFSIDKVKYNAAKNKRMEGCEELKRYGYRL